MAVINKKFVHFRTKAKFDEHLAAGDILNSSIVFIQNRKLLWTQGEFYGVDNYIIFENVEERDAFTPKNGQLSTILSEEPHKLYLYNGTGWVDLSLPDNIVYFNDQDDIELRTNTHILGKDINEEFHEILGLDEYPVAIYTPLADFELGSDLRNKTIKFDTTKVPFKLEEGNEGIVITEGGTWAFHVEVYETAIIMFCNGEEVYNNGWLVSEYTYPDTEAIVVYYPPLTKIDITKGFNPFADVTVSTDPEFCQVKAGNVDLHLELATNNKVTVETPRGQETVAVYDQSHVLWAEGPISIPNNSGLVSGNKNDFLSLKYLIETTSNELNRSLDQLPVGEDLGSRRMFKIKTFKPIAPNTLNGRLIWGDVTVDDQGNVSGTNGGYLRMSPESHLLYTDVTPSNSGSSSSSEIYTTTLWDGTNWLRDELWFTYRFGVWNNILITENTLSATADAIFTWSDFTETIEKTTLGNSQVDLWVRSKKQPKWEYIDGYDNVVKTFAMVEDITSGETPESIKEKYESNSNTNAFTDDEKSALLNIEEYVRDIEVQSAEATRIPIRKAIYNPKTNVLSNTTYFLNQATSTAAGLMIASDKVKLDGLSSISRLEMDLSDQILGTNNTFELGKEVKYPALYYNGLRQTYNKHYSITGTTLTLNFVSTEYPKVGEDLVLEYSE